MKNVTFKSEFSILEVIFRLEELIKEIQLITINLVDSQIQHYTF